MTEPPAPSRNAAADWEVCQRVLADLAQSPEQCLSLEAAARIHALAARLVSAVKGSQRRASRQRDQELIDEAGIRRGRREPGDASPAPPEIPDHAAQAESALRTLARPRTCYVCKRPYQRVHPFYDLMCPACGDENFARRTETADLTGGVAVVTGGRVKIGFQIALKLLRAGSRVLISSRFPCDAARRFAAEADFEAWRERLAIYALDFRHFPSVEQFAAHVRREHRTLDILINNAAQTIRRPPEFYRHLLEVEAGQRDQAPAPVRQTLINPEALPLLADLAEQAPRELDEAALRSLPLATALPWAPLLAGEAEPNPAEFPPGELDRHGQQVDRRLENSWVQRAEDVSTLELVEVHAVNCLAPYVLIRQFAPLLERPTPGTHVINVSAMEGRFNGSKTGFHPHTNMAKAALNMITRTCAEDFAARHIYMNSVDTGWVTNEFPYAKTQAMAEHGFEPPLDEIDGAARVCGPIFAAANTGRYVYGKFLKDYREISW